MARALLREVDARRGPLLFSREIHVSGSGADPLTKPAYPNAAAERAWKLVDIAYGRIPFRITRLIVFPSRGGLRQGLIFPASST